MRILSIAALVLRVCVIGAATAAAAASFAYVGGWLSPQRLTHPRTQARAGNSAGNYLFDQLIAQIHLHPLQWRLMMTIGQVEDPTSDATLPWPAERAQIDAGTVTLESISSEDGGPCTDINFDPLVLPPGIEPSDDPLLSARSAAYARSFALRAGEMSRKPPSAITPQEARAGSNR